MPRRRKEVINNILYHTVGGGAFRDLHEKHIVDLTKWFEFLNSLASLEQNWRAELEIEREVAAAFFDFEWKVKRAIEACSRSEQEKFSQVSEKLYPRNLSDLFFDESITFQKYIGDPRHLARVEGEMTESDLIKCIYYHGQGAGAFEQARIYKKIVFSMWDDLIAAIRKLKRFWIGRSFISRHVAAALINLPMYIEWQAESFREKDPNDPLIPQIRDIAARLRIEGRALFENGAQKH